MEIKKIFYRRYKNWKNNHFSAADGYNCPSIPLGAITCKGCDYEVVKVVRAENCNLKNRKVVISWGLNLNTEKQNTLKQVLAFDADFPAMGGECEIMLAC